MAHKNYSFAQKVCIKRSGLALQKTNALWPGCRIGVAVSGGEDSLVLLKVMKIRQCIMPFAFEIMALHCNPGYDPDSHKQLLPWLGKEGISAHIDVSSFGPEIFAAGTQGACFSCARERRKILFELCRRYRLTHLAMGHNADDLLATFLLNFCRNGRVSGMTINEAFFGGRLMLIRPLLLVDKKFVHQAARQWRLPVWQNPCPLSGKTARTQAGQIPRMIEEQIPGARLSMLNALKRWQLDLEVQKAKNRAVNPE